MKTIDRIRQKIILGVTKKQLQIVNKPKRFYYYDDSIFNENRRYI